MCRPKSKITLTLALSFSIVNLAGASELLFHFNNPSFGGNPNNSAHLLGLAGPQNQFPETREELTPLEEFNERLQRSLLGRITSAITSDIVDTNGNIQPGSFETIDYNINIVDIGGGMVMIETIDKVTGDRTVIEIASESL